MLKQGTRRSNCRFPWILDNWDSPQQERATIKCSSAWVYIFGECVRCVYKSGRSTKLERSQSPDLGPLSPSQSPDFLKASPVSAMKAAAIVNSGEDQRRDQHGTGSTQKTTWEESHTVIVKCQSSSSISTSSSTCGEGGFQDPDIWSK